MVAGQLRRQKFAERVDGERHLRDEEAQWISRLGVLDLMKQRCLQLLVIEVADEASFEFDARSKQASRTRWCKTAVDNADPWRESSKRQVLLADGVYPSQSCVAIHESPAAAAQIPALCANAAEHTVAQDRE